MYRKAVLTALVCLLTVPTLNASGRYALRGEVLADGPVRLQDLSVELHSDGGLIAQKAAVGPLGSFEFRGVGPGMHRLRVTTMLGEVIREEYVNIAGDPAPVTIRLEAKRSPAPGGLVSLRRLAHKPSKDVQKAWREAGKCARRGDHAGASAFLQQCVEMDPGYFEAQMNLGTERVLAGDPAGALAAYDRALEIDSSAAEVHVNRGILLLHFNRPSEAEASAGKALKLQESESAHYVLGMSLASQGKELKAASGHLRISAKPHPQALEAANRIDEYLKKIRPTSRSSTPTASGADCSPDW